MDVRTPAAELEARLSKVPDLWKSPDTIPARLQEYSHALERLAAELASEPPEALPSTRDDD